MTSIIEAVAHMPSGRMIRAAARAAVAAALMAAPMAASAQVRTVDPNTAIDADLAPGAPASSAAPTATASDPEPVYDAAAPAEAQDAPPPPPATTSAPAATGSTPAAVPAGPTPSADGTITQRVPGYQRDDVVAQAEGVFGKGTEGLAGIIEKILKDQGDPIGYIAGREASGAFFVGLRYGSGTFTHKIEGERKVYWTGPSVGFDVGGNASKVFVLVYNIYDTQQIFRRFPQGEGAAYLVGGFTATYLRYKDMVLIPIRLGVGWRLGVNAGYMKFTETGKLLPF